MLTLAQDTGGSNNGSETTETEQILPPPALLQSESNMSGSGARIILPLPVPSMGTGASPLVPTASRSSTSSGTFDSVAALGGANASTAANIQPSQRLSPDSMTITRLPSITADGLLIEARARDRSPPTLARPLDLAGSYGQDRLGALPTSPTSNASQGGGFSRPHPGLSHTDSLRRGSEATPVFPWMSSTETATVQN
jgi:hypothetical protein